MYWKDFFYYNKGSRSAIILLLILIPLSIILNSFISIKKSSGLDASQNDSIINEFMRSREAVVINNYGKSFKSKRNPVTDTSEIRSEALQYKNEISIASKSRSPAHFPRIIKLKEGETINLNEKDTTQWKKIPGIGSTYASRIVKYKNLLGGFFCKDQLMEVYGIDKELYSRIEPFIKTDSNYIKLNVNEMEFRDLLRHPYLNYNQVQTIFNLRDKKGRISSIEELSLLDEFTDDDIDRLRPYLQFL